MISYRIDLASTSAHLYRVTLSIPQPAARQRLSLPVWIPGSYLVREFARHLSDLRATRGGQPVPLTQLDKTTWEADCEGAGRGALVLSYLVYAFDNSVRTAWLCSRRGFFNASSLCLRAEGFEDQPQQLTLRGLPTGWEVATALPAVKVNARGEGLYQAADYDELVDQPVEMGRFWRGRFQAHGVAHELVVAGALPDFDGERLLADTRRICEAEIAFWHPNKRPPFQHYVFMLNAVEEGYGGLEHRASTALIAARRDLPQRGVAETSDGYVTLLGLISHEYFHTWNVKRLRPKDFAAYDYTQENYTELLWFFEGFTSYYDDLFLRRAGLIDTPRYLKLVARTVSGVLATPGRKVQSVARSSFDAWVKYYRQDENSPNATVSYYTKGALLALALDLSLRAHKASLDQVMRALWLRSAGGPISEADILTVVREQLGGKAGVQLAAQLHQWVHGTDDLPLAPLLARMGVAWSAAPATLAQRLGLKVSESPLTGIKISQVLRGGLAELAGLSAGDELLAVDDWRLRRLEDASRLLLPGQTSDWLVVRDQRLLRLKLQLPAGAAQDGGGAVQLAPAAGAGRAALALREAWLGA